MTGQATCRVAYCLLVCGVPGTAVAQDAQAAPDTEAAQDAQAAPDTEAAQDTQAAPDTEAAQDTQAAPDTEAAPDTDTEATEPSGPQTPPPAASSEHEGGIAELLDEILRTKLRLGYEQTSTEGSRIKVGEFDRLKPWPRGDGLILLDWGRFFADVRGSIRNDRDQQIQARGGASGWLQADVDVSRRSHRLEHDPLTNLGFDNGGTLDVVDADPERVYGIDRTQAKYTLRGHIPSIVGVDQIEVTGSYRFLRRQGHDQARTMSHCGSCHVHTDTRSIDQRTDEVTVGFQARVLESLSFAYRHLWRKLHERQSPPTWDYPEVPPEGQEFLPISGRQPFGGVPDTTRNVDRVSLHWTGPFTLRLSSHYAFSQSNNEQTGNHFQAHLAGLRATASPIKRLRMTAHYRYSSAQLSVAESIERSNHQLGTDLRFIPWSTLTLKASYDWELLTRNNVIVDRVAGPETFTTEGEYFIDRRDRQRMFRHRAKLGLSGRLLALRLRGGLSYGFTFVQNPLSTIGRQGSFAPGTGNRPQPDTKGIYPTLSRLPEKVHEIRADLRWNPRMGLSIHPVYSFRIADSKLASRTWNDHSVGLTAVYLPTTWLQLSTAYHLRMNRIRTELYYGQVGGLRTDDEGWVDIAPDSLYAGTSHSGFASLGWSPRHDVRIRTTAVLSRSEAGFESDGATEDMGSLSAQTIETRGLSIGIDWSLSDDWLIGSSYQLDEYVHRPTGLYDGRAHVVWVYLTWSHNRPAGGLDG